jgi:tetratricopeptide (TPR) repeat protein
MKKNLLMIFAMATWSVAISQESKKTTSEKLLEEFSENGCKCIDSIETYNKSKKSVSKEIGQCIDKQTVGFQMGIKLSQIEEIKEKAVEVNGKKEVNIEINTNENSQEYQKYYFQIERYMMENCATLKSTVAGTEKQNENSVSNDKKALEFYSQGLKASKDGDYKKAVEAFEKAVKQDPKFAFAWDNLGLNYRRLNDFDKAIESYSKSLKIDPDGMMPLQNIAVAYQYKKEYKNAIDAYEKLSKVDPSNPEVFYGIGTVYAVNLRDFEKGLDNFCKAYNIYVEHKSPYRSDAEKQINYIYGEMKKLGKENKFQEILQANNINSN